MLGFGIQQVPLDIYIYIPLFINTNIPSGSFANIMVTLVLFTALLSIQPLMLWLQASFSIFAQTKTKQTKTKQTKTKQKKPSNIILSLRWTRYDSTCMGYAHKTSRSRFNRA
jgi:hypothetical protein